MPDPKETAGFIDRAQLPRFNASTSIHRVFKELGERGQSGFIVDDGGRPVRYVDARALGRAVEREASTAKKRGVKLGRQLVRHFMDRLPDDAVVPIQFTPVPLDALEARSAEQPRAGFVVTDGGREVGWYLRREWMREVQTRRVKFRCVNNHDNYDPDTDWRCNVCTLPLKRVEEDAP